MSRTILRGVNGSNPLGFLSALGLLRVMHARTDSARLGFASDGSFHAYTEGFDGELPALVAEDAARAERERPTWWLDYDKQEKKGGKRVADLKAPPERFKSHLIACVKRWLDGDTEAVAYAAAFETSVARDGKDNTKPTALHFTAANQQFLGTVELIRAMVTVEWAARSLFEGHAARPGPNLRWDPTAERNWALMANDPTKDRTTEDAPLEWLAFRALPLLPCVPVVNRFGGAPKIATTAVSGHGDDMRLTWPLWSNLASLESVRSLLQLDWTRRDREHAPRGVFAVCTSEIRRTSQGFGNFGPAAVTC